MATDLTNYWYILVGLAVALFAFVKYSKFHFYGLRRCASALVAILFIYGVLLAIGPAIGLPPTLTTKDLTRIVIFTIATAWLAKSFHDPKNPLYLRGAN